MAATYPDDPGVLTALAEAEYDAGHDAEAIAAADKVIARDPTRVNAYVQKGYALFRKAAAADDPKPAYAAAMRPFAALNKMENNHPLPLFYFYRSQVERGLEPDETARAALEQASVLAPFDQGLQISAGMMLIAEGKHSAARQFLGPVAANPHGGGAAAWAKQLITIIANTADGEKISMAALEQARENVAEATDDTGGNLGGEDEEAGGEAADGEATGGEEGSG